MAENKKLSTTKKSAGKNTMDYIIVHHTGGGTFESNCKLLSGNGGTQKDVSVHFIIGQKGEFAEIGDIEDILFHAGEGIHPITKRKCNMNQYCVGIEVVSDGTNFSYEQEETLPVKIKYISDMIFKRSGKRPEIKRHKDISGYRGKWDIGDNIFAGYASFEAYIKTGFSDPEKEAEKEKAIGAVKNLWSYLDKRGDTEGKEKAHESAEIIRKI